MNLGEIELKLYDRLSFNPTPDSPVTRRMRGYINDAHREILGKKDYSRLRRKTLTCASIANSPMMALPQAATKIINIADRSNNRNLDAVSLQDIRYRDPGLNFQSAIPDSYCLFNTASCVFRDPSAADSLFVVSDSAVDGTGLSANIEGILADGTYRRAAVAMNGLTAVNIDLTCTTWLYVTKFYISGGAAGSVTLHQTSGVGTELSRIVKGRSYPRYTIVHLSGTPSAVYTYYADVDLHIEDMVNVNDEPLLPEDFHWLLETGAMKREFKRRGKIQEFGTEQSEWKTGLGDLSDYLRARPGVSNAGQRSGSRPRGSQLGPMFSAGS